MQIATNWQNLRQAFDDCSRCGKCKFYARETGLGNHLQKFAKHFNDLFAGFLRIAAQGRPNQ
jgi:hypothetical protein